MDGLAAPMFANDDLSRAWWDLNDSGNARRFKAAFGSEFLHVRGQGWLAYDGKAWTREGAETRALLAARATVSKIKDEAKALFEAARDPRASDGKIDPKILAARAAEVKEWARSAGSINRLKGLLSIAAAELECSFDDFDRDPYALNVQNGTVRFVHQSDGTWAARLDRHDPDDKISRICAFDFKPDASSQLWDSHMTRTIPDVAEREFLMRTIGYCALGLISEQVFFIWQGRGGDGKSVTSSVVRRVLGTYAAKVDVKTFLEDRTGRSAAQASPDIARLAGAVRFVVASEPPKGARLNEALVKDFTGGAPLVARHLNQAPFEFLPRFRLVIDCNPLPGIGGADDGIWRRVKLIPFREQLKRDEMDPSLEGKLVDAGQGVLAAIVRSALEYLSGGLRTPESIDVAITGFKADSNPFRDWLDAYTIAEPGYVIEHKALYVSYREAMEGLGVEPMSSNLLSKALTEMQIERSRKAGKGDTTRIGVRLRTAAEREARVAAPAAAATFTPTPAASQDIDPEPMEDADDADGWRYEGN